MFVSSSGSPYARFRRALATENLLLIRAAAAELPRVDLGDALTICVLLRDREPERYEQATVRWLGRFCLERAATVAQVRDAVAAFELLRRDPPAALARLRALTG